MSPLALASGAKEAAALSNDSFLDDRAASITRLAVAPIDAQALGKITWLAIVVGDDGTIVIPAAACDRPTNSTDKVIFMPSWEGGTQIHYGRLGERPELIRYTIEAPAAGKYELVAQVATVSPKQVAILRLNRRTLLDVQLPYTKGLWEETEPVVVELKEGRNSVQLTSRAPNRGLTMKEFRLKPVK